LVRLEVSGNPVQESQIFAVQFVVQDTGIGISTARQQAIFGAFVQEDDSTTRRFGGTGLGLTIVRQLVLGLGGDLQLESTSGQGSRFVVTLPLLPAVPQPSGQPVTAAARVQESLELLLVDDNPINLAVTEHLLRLLGHKPILASSAADAMRWLSHSRADVVLMDVHMPDVDGLAATRLLREQGIAVPIVALTAQAMPGDRERCLAAGMNGYLRKPLEPSQLQAELAAVLASRQPQVAGQSREDLYRFVGDPALADQLLALFCKDWQVLRNTWLQPADPARLQASLHRVRGSLLHFGLDQLAHQLELAEMDLRVGEPGAVAAVLAHAPQLARAVDAALAAWQVTEHPDSAA
jgi:CheY-like chemotaxis protein